MAKLIDLVSLSSAVSACLLNLSLSLLLLSLSCFYLRCWPSVRLLVKKRVSGTRHQYNDDYRICSVNCCTLKNLNGFVHHKLKNMKDSSIVNCQARDARTTNQPTTINYRLVWGLLRLAPTTYLIHYGSYRNVSPFDLPTQKTIIVAYKMHSSFTVYKKSQECLANSRVVKL